MVTQDESDLHRRIRRLETLIAVLIATDEFDPPDMDFFIRRFLERRDYDDRGEFDYLLIDLLKRRRLPDSIYDRVDAHSNQLSNISEQIRELTSYNYKVSLTSKLEELTKRTEKLAQEIETIRTESYENFLIDTMGLNHDQISQLRYVPLRIYISEDSPELVKYIETAVTSYCDSLGFLPAVEYEPESGSWFKKFIAKSKTAMTSEQAEDAFKKGKRAIELATIDKKRAEINRDNAEAAANFIKALADIPHAAAQFGSLLVIKTKNPDGEYCILTRTLTEREMEFIETNQGVMKDVGKILDKLDNLKIA